MTEAARLSSGPYIDNEARTVIACCRASAQPPREHLGSVPRHQPWRGALSTRLDRPHPPGWLTPKVLSLDSFNGDDRCDLLQSNERIFVVLVIGSGARIGNNDHTKVEVVCVQCRRQHCYVRGHTSQEKALRV